MAPALAVALMASRQSPIDTAFRPDAPRRSNKEKERCKRFDSLHAVTTVHRVHQDDARDTDKQPHRHGPDDEDQPGVTCDRAEVYRRLRHTHHQVRYTFRWCKYRFDGDLNATVSRKKNQITQVFSEQIRGSVHPRTNMDFCSQNRFMVREIDHLTTPITLP